MKTTPKPVSKTFARSLLNEYVNKNASTSYTTLNRMLNVLEIPMDLTFKERLAYFTLYERDE